MYEHNEARMKDVEVPLFKLEQKVEKLEQQFAQYQIGVIDKLVEASAHKINQSPMVYLPAIYKKVMELIQFRDKFDGKLPTTQTAAAQSLAGEQSQQQTFALNNLKNEIDFFKKTFSVTRIQQIDDMQKKLNNQELLVNFLKMNQSNFAKNEEVESIYKKLNDYAQVYVVRDMQDSFQDLVKKEELNVLAGDIEYLKKDFGKLINKEEFMTRLNVFNSEVNSKLADRPTTSYFKKVLSAYDQKIESFNDSLNDHIDKLDRTQADQDKEIAQLNLEVTKCNHHLNLKMEKNDGTKIWQHFQRFAEYSDLKDLYTKTLPELAKFEQKIINFEQEIEKNAMIIRRFDEHLSQKSNKTAITELYDYIKAQCALKSEQENFLNKIEKKIKQQDSKVKDQKQMLETLSKSLTGQIQKEIKLATALITGSAFDEEEGDKDESQHPRMSKKQESIIFQRKVDKKDFIDAMMTKASQSEVEMQMRQIEILHKQIQQISFLISQKFRLSLDNSQNQNKNEKINQKVNLLNQALLLSNWIQNFNSNQINDCFDNSQNKLPKIIKDYESSLIDDFRKIQKMQLSPNNSQLNQFVKGSSLQILDRGMNKMISGRSLISNKYDLSSPIQRLSNKQLAQSIDISSAQSLNQDRSNSQVGKHILNQSYDVNILKKSNQRPTYDTIFINQQDSKQSLKGSSKKHNTNMQIFIKGDDPRGGTSLVKKKKMKKNAQQKQIENGSMNLNEEEMDKISRESIDQASIIVKNDGQMKSQTKPNTPIKEQDNENMLNEETQNMASRNILKNKSQISNKILSDLSVVTDSVPGQKYPPGEAGFWETLNKDKKKQLQIATTKMLIESDLKQQKIIRKSEVTGLNLPGIYNKN